MIIVADENLDQFIIDCLIDGGFDVYPISKHIPGASDRQVLNKATELNAILITEDKDFG